MTLRILLLLFTHFFLIHRAESSPSTDKLIAWVKENSEIFILLKHWNELPLISTSWKRLKDSPQVIEDQRIFLEALESTKNLHSSSEEQVRNKSRSATVDSTSYTKNDSVIEEKTSIINDDLSVINKIKVLGTDFIKLNETFQSSGNNSETNQTTVLCGSRIESE